MMRRFQNLRIQKRYLAYIAVGFYVIVMLSVSVIILAKAFQQGQTVCIDDRETLRNRNTAAIPVSLEVQDFRWGTADMKNRDEMLEISQRIYRNSALKHGLLEADAPVLNGKITYIDGESNSFSLNDSLLCKDPAYCQSNGLFDLRCAAALLQKQVYTVENLADFFVPEHNVVLIAGNDRVSISPGDIKTLREIILAGTSVEGAELDYAIRSRGIAKYVISVKKLDDTGGWLFLSVYGNDYNEVYDVQSGKGIVFCLSGKLFPFCQKLIGKQE